jgi:hypothetical protein
MVYVSVFMGKYPNGKLSSILLFPQNLANTTKKYAH